MNRHTRYAQAWPHGSTWDDNSFHTSEYNDWDEHNSHDYQDRHCHHSNIQPRSGHPHRTHGGASYIPSTWRHTNNSGGAGNIIRWNEPTFSHSHNKHRRMAFVWPSDGKRKTTIGRWKDILTSRGPDIFVTKQGDRPSRNQWRSNWLDSTPEDPYYSMHVDLPWARRRRPYDFPERRYRNPRGCGDEFWSDATWPSWGADRCKLPLNYRCENGQWYNMAWA